MGVKVSQRQLKAAQGLTRALGRESIPTESESWEEVMEAVDTLNCDAEDLARLTREWDEAREAARVWRERFNLINPLTTKLRARAEQAEAERDRLREALASIEYIADEMPRHKSKWQANAKLILQFARAALQPDKGERLSQQERDTLAEARAIVEGAQATRQEMDRKYDKREAICAECESDPSVTPGTCECPGHRDVSNVRPARTARRQPDKGERCETCGGTRWLDPRAEHAPCPDCKEDVR